MNKKLSAVILVVTGALTAPFSLAEQATPSSAPAEKAASGRVLLEIATGYAVSREPGKMLATPSAARWGFIDEQGKVVIEPKFDAVGTSRESITAVSQNGKWGWIDQKGSFIDAQLPGSVEFHEGLAAFKRDGKAGFIDVTGKVVIEPQWDEARDFSESLAAVKQNGLVGFIDKSGKPVIKPHWEMVDDFHDVLAAVKENGKCGFIDKTGKVVIKTEWDDAMVFRDGYAVVSRGNNKWGAIDKQGKLVIPLEWETLFPCSLSLEPAPQYDGAREVVRPPNEKRACVDSKGKLVTDPSFEKIGGFSHRLDPMNKGEWWGLIDATKRFVVEPEWEIVIPHQVTEDQVYWMVAREDKTANGKNVLVEWLDPKGKKIWSSGEPPAR